MTERPATFSYERSRCTKGAPGSTINIMGYKLKMLSLWFRLRGLRRRLRSLLRW
jgi:hypothetical protein